MTANVAGLIPRALVLIDTAGLWAGRVLRGQRGVVVHRYESGIGSAMGADVVVCIGPCGKPEHDMDCPSAVAFKADELLLVPADSTEEHLYRCCHHGECPSGCQGHPLPCRTCGQPLARTADQAAARAMAHDEYGVGIGPAT